MIALYAIVGFVIGLLLSGWGGNSLLGAVGGVVIGILLARLGRIQQRLDWLEATRDIAPPVPPPELKPFHAEAKGEPLDEAEFVPPPPDPWMQPTPTEPAPPVDIAAGPEIPPPADGWAEPDRSPAYEAGPSLAERLTKSAIRWFSTGNIPVKVGVPIIFIGVSFLLKYAVDQKWMVVPIEVRLLLVAALGLGLLFTGWRLRERARVYALSLQGGGIGIIYLTLFAAFRIWSLLPPVLAFVLLVLLTVAAGALSVLQNSRTLAILAVVGGFLAPVLTSTGRGSHVALFSYYLVLNGAILGISWFRAWRELNLIGFVFTFLIGSAWGYRYYKPELLASTQPFLVLHFLFYQAIAILYALRQPPEKVGVVDGTLVFGTPVIVFALQAALVHGIDYALAYSAAAAAVFYALTARYLFQRQGDYLRLLIESFIALAVAFATIAIPLALDARWTSAAWALEGAALVWIGSRQGRLLAKLAGIALVGFSGFAFMENGWHSGRGMPVLNGNVLGGALISLAALFSSRRLSGADARPLPFQPVLAGLLFLWGAAWWLGTGFAEITDRADWNDSVLLGLAFLSASALLDAWLARRWQWDLARWACWSYLPLMMIFAALFVVLEEHFLWDAGWLAWPVAWAIQGLILYWSDEHSSPLLDAWHVISTLFLVTFLAFELGWRVDQVLGGQVWGPAAGSLVPGLAAMLIWRLRQRPDWPVAAHWSAYLLASLVLVGLQMLYVAIGSTDVAGNPAPLSYIPLLNPFDIAMLFTLLTGFMSVAIFHREIAANEKSNIRDAFVAYRGVVFALAMVLTTVAVVRGVHHYTGVPWRSDALYDSVVVQTALSIWWSLLGFTGMIWGTRSGRRSLWLAGALFMAVVVIKLFVVDLGNSGTGARIVSFMGVGALLLVVGYFAPAPPRTLVETEDENESSEESP